MTILSVTTLNFTSKMIKLIQKLRYNIRANKRFKLILFVEGFYDF